LKPDSSFAFSSIIENARNFPTIKKALGFSAQYVRVRDDGAASRMLTFRLARVRVGGAKQYVKLCSYDTHRTHAREVFGAVRACA